MHRLFVGAALAATVSDGICHRGIACVKKHHPGPCPEMISLQLQTGPCPVMQIGNYKNEVSRPGPCPEMPETFCSGFYPGRALVK